MKASEKVPATNKAALTNILVRAILFIRYRTQAETKLTNNQIQKDCRAHLFSSHVRSALTEKNWY
ncbi:hypothetical protein [Oceanobacillus sojae]|uniref:hypothetical protein n=1 Tax=Oceanobacillus sojae TaxID=582851 RepID=UPI000988470B|nr:hypothetical protein [Oceanobacillus sojae]MCT1905280.1 hypothetical protein [Oceanobacillus sojae]